MQQQTNAKTSFAYRWGFRIGKNREKKKSIADTVEKDAESPCINRHSNTATQPHRHTDAYTHRHRDRHTFINTKVCAGNKNKITSLLNLPSWKSVDQEERCWGWLHCLFQQTNGNVWRHERPRVYDLVDCSTLFEATGIVSRLAPPSKHFFWWLKGIHTLLARYAMEVGRATRAKFQRIKGKCCIR